MEVLQNLKIELPYDPVIPLRGIYVKECKPAYSRDVCTPMFIAAQFAMVLINKQMDKENVVYIQPYIQP
jgi:hypothetical protein